ncbi:IclR family transcriptional regulator [Paracoccus saliphilus]|uniref:IclR family transcriptional regulator n=1 Tax=Paracoccus saliphilus TaxID=405559 RepID=A0AA45W7W5_9RHOB|nr:IclR family transcriptional regulator [Paracoccus saliphilus]WCR01550.1 IclR family transcriptional regulator [Paracoccus saliphilus]SIT12497.1 transcriptional regulator, IclR family [Paracoccus saliphilus]
MTKEASDEESAGGKKQGVEAVERALTILEAFADGTPSLTLTELSNRTGYYMSTLLRLSASLERFGYLNRNSHSQFQLGPTLLRLGLIYQGHFDLSVYIRPSLRKLAERTQESAAFYVKDGNRRICLFRHHAPGMLRHHVEEGAILPLDRGAGGRILAAFSGKDDDLHDGVRADGYYISKGERDPNVSSVSVPVFGENHSFIGALAVAGPSSRMEGDYESILLAVRETAEDLERKIGGRRPSA